jgi:replicative DNA helicase
MSESKSLPNNEIAEKYILGGILLNNNLFDECLGELLPSDFYNKSHQSLYEAMIDVVEHTGTSEINHITIIDSLKSSGKLGSVKEIIELVSELKKGLPTPKNLKHYIRLVKKAKVDREKLIISDSLQTALLSGNAASIEDAEQKLYDLTIAETNTGTEHTSGFSNEVLNKVHTVGLAGKAVTGLATGIFDFDIMTAGLQPEDLMILAARPGAGKTAIAMNIAQFTSIKRGNTVLVFSMEMSRNQLLLRMLSAEARIPIHNLRKGLLSRHEWGRLVHASEYIDSGRIIINEQTSLTTPKMRNIVKKVLAKEKRLDLVIVDYLQLMNSGNWAENRQQEVTQISKSLKNMAKEFKIPVLALSQLSRAPEQRTSTAHRPQLSDLRESGAIEQDADIVSFIYREEMYGQTDANKNKAELIIGKHRHGVTGSIPLAFLGAYTKFENIFLV